ncbi:hypothetical protein [Helicobacter japonicus]|uniref:hypothetical protein n=1 Tax=Helicobacter japonicus TaxID=425400 RepID=UPI00321FC484
MTRDKQSLKDGDDVYPGKIVGYVGNTGKQFTSWYKTSDGKDEQRKTQEIDDNDRKYGYGAHLHLQFIKSDNIISPVNPISYNPINHSEKWRG